MSSAEHFDPAPGWYPDPTGDGLRWWSGVAWTANKQSSDGEFYTENMRGTVPGTGQATSPSAAGSITGLVGGFLLLVSTGLAWGKAAGQNFNAFDGGLPWFLSGADAPSFTGGWLAHGWLFVLAGLAAWAFTILASRRANDWAGTALLGTGIFVALLSLIDFFALRGVLNDFVDSGTGLGVWLAFLCGLALAVSGSMLMARR